MLSFGKLFGYSETKVDIENETKSNTPIIENETKSNTPIIDIESEEENEEENENFLGTLLFENPNVKFYLTQAKVFSNKIEIWAGQRPLHIEHIKMLAREFTREGHVIGTFKVVRSEGKLRLLDGQHRIHAIKEILKIQPNFDCDIFIELYETDRLESSLTLRLFEKANNVLNVKPEDMPHKSALSIVDKLSTRFKVIFKDIEDGERCNRPYINKRKLYDKLKRAFQQHDIDEDSLYKQILEYNEFNRKTKLDIIDLSTASINKCKQSSCYLGFDKDLSWLDDILSIY